jgi:tetratricopeptide (TPR) repeat protein
MRQALEFHRRGELAAARRLYEEILEREPRDADALNMLGVICGQSKDFDRAEQLFGEAIRINPHIASVHCNRGAALRELKRLDAALASYDQALALKADYAVAHYNRGNVLKDLKRPEGALSSYERAIAINPRYTEAYYNRGLVLQALGRYEAAVSSYDRAISCKPDHADAFCNRGIALSRLRRHEAALASHDRSIALKPESAEAHSNRGVVLKDLLRFEEALASCDRALLLKPAFVEAHTNRGVVLGELGRFEEAFASHDRALELDPGCAEAHCNRGTLHHSRLELDAAEASFTDAIALKADYAQAYENRAYTRLLAGKLDAGWIDYQWRWKHERHAANPAASFRQPLWLGDGDLAGKTLFVHGEQGLGDRIQFCRYVKRVAERGARVIVQTEPPLTNLFSSLEGVSRVIEQGSELPAFDLHCPLLSLPLAFKTTLATVPAEVPYLTSSPDKRARWRAALGEKKALRVGLVWSGGVRPNQPELAWLHRRNIALSKLAPLKHPRIEFYSLQKGQPAEGELAALAAQGWDGPAITDFTARLHDFSDTAALIEELDLVISVDTSTAHLAGALGKPVWILNRFDTCWRWLLERTDSPWYPTARLYRQARPGDWDGVIDQVRRDLMQWAGS